MSVEMERAASDLAETLSSAARGDGDGDFGPPGQFAVVDAEMTVVAVVPTQQLASIVMAAITRAVDDANRADYYAAQ